MTRRSRIWLVLAVLFVLVNAGGMVAAAVAGEVVHTGIHAVLTLLGVYLVWRLAPRRATGY
ncbi:MAG TPA: hypothetical protein VGE02_07090 [Gemmatimonadales bacterium]